MFGRFVQRQACIGLSRSTTFNSSSLCLLGSQGSSLSANFLTKNGFVGVNNNNNNNNNNSSRVRYFGNSADSGSDVLKPDIPQLERIEDSIVRVTFVDTDGKRYEAAGLVGTTLSQVSDDHKLDVLIDYGAGTEESQKVNSDEWVEDTYKGDVDSYHTCVTISNEYIDKMPPPSAGEIEKLDDMEQWGWYDRNSNSRLASRIRLTKEMDGMVVYVPDHAPVFIE